jgi:hypothetical protein
VGVGATRDWSALLASMSSHFPARLALRSALLAATLVACSVFAAPTKADRAYIQAVADGRAHAAGVPEKAGKRGWWARSWATAEGTGFHGMPQTLSQADETDSTLVIRYTQFTARRDAMHHAPPLGSFTKGIITVERAIAEEPMAVQAHDRPTAQLTGIHLVAELDDSRPRKGNQSSRITCLKTNRIHSPTKRTAHAAAQLVRRAARRNLTPRFFRREASVARL